MIGTARQKATIQLPHRYIISVNALATRRLVNCSKLYLANFLGCAATQSGQSALDPLSARNATGLL